VPSKSCVSEKRHQNRCQNCTACTIRVLNNRGQKSRRLLSCRSPSEHSRAGQFPEIRAALQRTKENTNRNQQAAQDANISPSFSSPCSVAPSFLPVRPIAKRSPGPRVLARGTSRLLGVSAVQIFPVTATTGDIAPPSTRATTSATPSLRRAPTC
jgi:hypothetical protein